MPGTETNSAQSYVCPGKAGIENLQESRKIMNPLRR